jgi:hypothetical protein
MPLDDLRQAPGYIHFRSVDLELRMRGWDTRDREMPIRFNLESPSNVIDDSEWQSKKRDEPRICPVGSLLGSRIA